MSTSEPDAPLQLHRLVELSLATFTGLFADRLRISGGPVVHFAPSAAIPLALCLHELATDAVYGALSRHAGRVECDWVERVPGS
jgi:two-component sensor histidine kinase